MAYRSVCITSTCITRHVYSSVCVYVPEPLDLSARLCTMHRRQDSRHSRLRRRQSKSGSVGTHTHTLCGCPGWVAARLGTVLMRPVVPGARCRRRCRHQTLLLRVLMPSWCARADQIPVHMSEVEQFCAKIAYAFAHAYERLCLFVY